MHMKQIIALALSLMTAEATYKGFNYASTNEDGSARYKADFAAQFQNAKNLVGTSGFTSARLYTMIQEGTTNTPIEAIQAAIEEETSLLLGIWASGGNVDNEILALTSAISTYGTDFTDLVVGICVGSEDLYRNSVIGEESNAGVGLNPDVLVTYIKDVKSAISGTSLSSASVGHVDTWNAWTNTSNSAVIDEIDWLGFDIYPYYQTTDDNSIDNAKSLFDEAFAKTKAVANGKEIWVTETGWPVSGPDEGEGVASIANAKTYWDQVGCSLFGNINTWWYIQQDYGASPSFGIVGETLSTTPLFNLACNTTSTYSSSSAASTSTGVTVGRNGNATVSGFRSVAATTSSSSGSSTSSSVSASSIYFNAANRPAASIFGAVVAAIGLAIAL